MNSSTDLCLSVLVVDDASVIRLVIAQHLESLGHQALEASSGEEAIEFLRGSNIDAVLLDLQMPEMTGYEVLRWVRETPRDRWLPVIVISADDTVATMRLALECGADDFMTKPICPITLNTKLSKFFKPKERARAPADL